MKILAFFLLCFPLLAVKESAPEYRPWIYEEHRNLNMFISQISLENSDFDSTKYLSYDELYATRNDARIALERNWNFSFDSEAELKFEDLRYINPISLRHKLNDIRILEMAAIGDTTVPQTNPNPESFYIRKFEVTNYEYRIFVNWVRDSIARTILENKLNPEEWLIPTYDALNHPLPSSEWLINWSRDFHYDFPRNADEPNYREILTEMFFPPHERFNKKREIDTRKLFYQWSDDGMEKIINVYPDTLCWFHNHSHPSYEPMTKTYFSHPYYDMYPVVGLTYDQILAYCNWKEKMMNQYFSRQKNKKRVEIKPPTFFEVWLDQLLKNNTSNIQGDIFQTGTLLLKERDYINYRHLFQGDQFKRNEHYNWKQTEIRNEINHFKHSKHYQKLNAFVFKKYNIFNQEKKHSLSYTYNQNNWLHVSEWTSTPYTSFYENLFRGRSSSFYTTPISNPYIYEINSKQGQLVCGNNWFHEKKHNDILVNQSVHRDSTNATVGFRYTVKIYKKNREAPDSLANLKSYYMGEIMHQIRKHKWEIVNIRELLNLKNSQTLKLVRVLNEKTVGRHIDFNNSDTIKLGYDLQRLLTSDISKPNKYEKQSDHRHYHQLVFDDSLQIHSYTGPMNALPGGVIDGVVLVNYEILPYKATYKFNPEKGILRVQFIGGSTMFFKIQYIDNEELVLERVR